ncbi:MAG: DUF4446 family protein [Actinomycetes bacterium]
MSEVSGTVVVALIVVASLAAVVAVLSMVVAFMALRVARRSTREYRKIANADQDVVDALLDRISGIDASTKAVQDLAHLVQATRDDVAHTLRHVSVVRYDAFRDLSGRLSYSAALLDDTGDGIIFTSLRYRNETQYLAKGVAAGQVEGLSPEEEQAVTYALKGSET